MIVLTMIISINIERETDRYIVQKIGCSKIQFIYFDFCFSVHRNLQSVGGSELSPNTHTFIQKKVGKIGFCPYGEFTLYNICLYVRYTELNIHLFIPSFSSCFSKRENEKKTKPEPKNKTRKNRRS